MSIAIFTDSATKSQIFRLTNHKPLNKYFWEKEKALVVEKLSKDRNIDKDRITVKDL